MPSSTIFTTRFIPGDRRHRRDHRTGAELGRMGGIGGLPAAFVALVLGHADGLGLAALRAELPGGRGAAAALPAPGGGGLEGGQQLAFQLVVDSCV